MVRRSPRPRFVTRAARACVAGAVTAAFVALSACILADPPAGLPALPTMRPTIVHGAVVPSAARILGRLPEQFQVPVELLDPAVTFEWRVFVDYDPLAPSNAVFAGTNEKDPLRPLERIRTVPFGNPIATADPSLQACHVIEFLVAYSFEGTSSHTPGSTGGDTIAWFYNPAGDLAGCPQYDAGAFADAGVPPPDAADGARE